MCAGIEIHPHGFQTSFHLKAYTICACFDLPARASALNVMQYNGQYGCNFCEQPGTSIRTEKGGHVLTFPYQNDSPKGPPRTHKTQIDYARKATEERSVVSININIIIIIMHVHACILALCQYVLYTYMHAYANRYISFLLHQCRN